MAETIVVLFFVAIVISVVGVLLFLQYAILSYEKDEEDENDDVSEG